MKKWMSPEPEKLPETMRKGITMPKKKKRWWAVWNETKESIVDVSESRNISREYKRSFEMARPDENYTVRPMVFDD